MIKLLKRLLESISATVRRWRDDDLVSVLDTQEVSVDLDPRDFAGSVLRAEDKTVPQTSQITRNSTPQQQTPQTGSAFSQELLAERAASNSRDFSRAVSGAGRVSVESQSDIRFNPGVSEFIQLNTDNDRMDIFNYSEDYVRGLKPAKLLEMLSEASPEMSRALFDFLLMCVPGWELKAVGKNDEIDTRADEYLKQCVEKLALNYKAPEVVFVKYFMSAFLRGSLCSEIVLSKRGTDFVDISMIDPDSIEHHRVNDPVRGLIWKIYQRQGHTVADLNVPQVAYIPIHPFFGTNKGRPLARPAIFVCFFLIATLQDLRRVIRQQGYPRIDISVNIEKLKQMIPQAKANDMSELKKFADAIITEVKTIYKGLKPDDTFIHTEVVEVNQPVGTLNSSSLGVVGELLSCLERMATRALKTMPLLMATTDGVSEANANRQWEIHVAGIKSMQHNAEAILEDHFNLALRAKGFQARAVFRFAELRAAELLRDAQTELVKTTVARLQYDNGSISADEMALKSAGKKKADQEGPRSAPAVPNDSTDAAGSNSDPGSNRKIDHEDLMNYLLRMTLQDAADAKTLFDQYAPEKAKGLLNAATQ